jgi:hypothetical protein
LQLGQINQRAAFKQGVELLWRLHLLPTRQQQGFVSVAHIEGQRGAEVDAVPDGRQGGKLHGVGRFKAVRLAAQTGCRVFVFSAVKRRT